MPLMQITVRFTLGVSPQRKERLRAGDNDEFIAMQDELRNALKADNLVIDDVEDTISTLLRIER